MALWGGRFETGPDAIFREINDSLRFDARLALHDIDGSIAWANALARANVLTDEEHLRLKNALLAMRATIAADPELPLRDGRGNDEDIHSFVERRLTESLGPLAKKLHTGRSRNDQVATDLRLWTRDAIDARLIELMTARASLLDLASRERSTVISGYTHLQRAQPLLLAHWALAYEAMLARDSARFRDARARVNLCPLGSGALAGTAYPIDRHALAQDLHFAAPTTNSLDAVSDRDFVLETLAAATIAAVHLSRLAEEIVIWTSPLVGLVTLSDKFTTGSSIMPQKRNPVALEHARTRFSRVLGSAGMVVYSSHNIPFADLNDFGPDVQGALHMQHQQLVGGLDLLTACLEEGAFDTTVLAAAAAATDTTATELADVLVRDTGLSFPAAHAVVGKLVVTLQAQGRQFTSVTPADVAAAGGPHLPADALRDAVDPARFVARRRGLGMPAAEAMAGRVAAQREGIEADAAALASEKERLAAARSALRSVSARSTPT